ncbi:DUF2336 domain-containing protein [Pelagibius sp. Alg239-R121]|uniref:DUF2336 domain-containing protein n=1 Tax=Pelagibius sp. Alg239-R121 TaxID=2993448 RepID=UPI0024A6C7F3|nr:DUF2336 domain-containing protein [Pelagibius sp. Alg239-R121]
METKKTLRGYNADYLVSEMQPEKRAEVARKLGGKLDTGLSELERELTWAIARQLAEDAVEVVRESLARSVRGCKFLPKDIGYTLAYDLDSVAVPFLEVTEIFSENELCAIALAVSDSVRSAIAGREDLTSKVSGLLAELGDADVAHTLIENEPAEIDESGFAALTKRFCDDQTLFEKMATRTDLPPSIATELVKRVSDSAREQLETRYSMAPDFVNVLAQDAQSNALLKLAEFATAAEAMGYAKELYGKGELTHTFCLMAIRNGNLPFFEAAMAVRTGISVENVELILRDGGVEATGKLCTKAKIPNFLHREIAETVDREVQAMTDSSTPVA